MRILYDGCIYKFQKAGGINRYLANIIKFLPNDWHPTLSLFDSDNLLLPVHHNLVIKSFPIPRLRPQRLARWASECFFSQVESQSKINLIHSTYHVTLAGARSVKRQTPSVLTVHDMIPEIFSDDLDPQGTEAEIKRKACEYADAIICDSNNTKKDLLERIKIPEEKIFVIPLASELTSDMAMGVESVPACPYFLFVGSRAIYKNFVRLVLAFAPITRKWPDVKLYVIGPSFDSTERGLFRALNISDRVENLGRVSDRHLAKLYRCATALVYPSLYEGFGIPPLEAMACGGIVVCSNKSSLPEVTGEACISIDPMDTDSLSQGLLEALNLGVDSRQDLIHKGLNRASQFSWGETTNRTIAVYQHATDL